MSATATVASQIASGNLNEQVGFDFIPIITLLLPIFSQWLQSCQNPTPASPVQTPQEFLTDHYDVETNEYDSHLVSQAMSKARQAARQNGDPRVKNRQLRLGVIATFDKARTADAATVQSVMSENPI